MEATDGVIIRATFACEKVEKSYRPLSKQQFGFTTKNRFSFSDFIKIFVLLNMIILCLIPIFSRKIGDVTLITPDMDRLHIE